MKNIKEFKTIIKLTKEHRFRIILCSIGIFISSFSYTLASYLNGKAIEEITNFNLKNTILFLLVYLFSEIFATLIGRLSSTNLFF